MIFVFFIFIIRNQSKFVFLMTPRMDPRAQKLTNRLENAFPRSLLRREFQFLNHFFCQRTTISHPSIKKYKKTQTKSCPKQKKHLGRLGTQRDQIYKNLKVSGLLKGLFGKYGQSFTREHSLTHCRWKQVSLYGRSHLQFDWFGINAYYYFHK